MLALVNASLLHGLIALLGFLVIAEGLGLVIAPSALGFLAGPGATRPSARGWTRLQGTGFMLLGVGLVLASVHAPGTELVVIALSLSACSMFAMAVLRRSAET